MEKKNGFKIGIFDPYLDDVGGGEKYMMTLAEVLSKENDVDVFWDGDNVLEKIHQRFSIDISKLKLTANIFDPKTPFVKRQLISKKYDIIVFLSDGSIPVVSSKKLFLHIQQPINLKISSKDKLKLKRVNKIFCNSHFTKEAVDRVFGVDSKLLYPPVSIFGMGENKENVILHVGRFRVMQVSSSDYKKQNVMISVFKEMVDEGLKNWKFIIAVSLNDENDSQFLKMKKLADGYPIEFMINTSNENLWKEGKRAKIYWHASGFGEDLEKYPELAEHFGISTVEAMGVGAVPVVINAGGQKEIVKDGENGFLWDTLREFKEKTFKLVQDEKLFKEMSKKSYERSKDFDLENFSKNALEIIK